VSTSSNTHKDSSPQGLSSFNLTIAIMIRIFVAGGAHGKLVSFNSLRERERKQLGYIRFPSLNGLVTTNYEYNAIYNLILIPLNEIANLCLGEAHNP